MWLASGNTVGATLDPEQKQVAVRVGYGTTAITRLLAGPQSSEWVLRGVVPDADSAALIWQNTRTGALYRWALNTAGAIRETGLIQPSAGWCLTCIRDQDNDGLLDLVWRNQLSGKQAVWFSTGRSLFGRVEILS